MLIISLHCVSLIALIATIDFMPLSAEWSIQLTHGDSMFSPSSVNQFIKWAHMHTRTYITGSRVHTFQPVSCIIEVDADRTNTH